MSQLEKICVSCRGLDKVRYAEIECGHVRMRKRKYVSRRDGEKMYRKRKRTDVSCRGKNKVRHAEQKEMACFTEKQKKGNTVHIYEHDQMENLWSKLWLDWVEINTFFLIMHINRCNLY